MKKRIIASVLTTTMLFAMLFIFAISTSAAMQWDGDSSLPFLGEGTVDSPYIISSAYNLKYLQEQVEQGNDFSGKYIVLNNDIDLCGKEWIPIGNAETTAFSGVFNGNQHMIYGLSTKSYTEYCGLFGAIKPSRGKDCIIANLTTSGQISYVDEDVFPKPLFVGGIAGCSLKGTNNDKVIINNCMSLVFIEIIKPQSGMQHLYIGGIIGRAHNTDFLGCTNNGTITALWGGSSEVLILGGITASAYNCNFTACVNQAKILAYQSVTNKTLDYVGGIVGVCSSTNNEIFTVFNNCANSGWISAVNGGNARVCAGGIIGSFYRGRVMINNCYNSGIIMGAVEDSITKYANSGGMVGYYDSSENLGCLIIEDCYDSGKVEGNNPGGIIGYLLINPQNIYPSMISGCQTVNAKIIGDGSDFTERCKVNAAPHSLDTQINNIIKVIEAGIQYDLFYPILGIDYQPIDTTKTTSKDNVITTYNDNPTISKPSFSCDSPSTIFSYMTVLALIGGTSIIFIKKKN